MIEKRDLTPTPWHLAISAPDLLASLDWTAQSDSHLLLCVDRRDGLDPARRADLSGSLSATEQRRHDGYHRRDDRDRFLLGRGLMRRLLAFWMQQPPQTITIALGPHGKPHCPGGPQFNVSHSGDLILLAVHRCRPVGVDVEQERPGIDWEPIARRVLSSAEVEGLLSRPEPERQAAFLQAWCRLEAELKAGGWGLAAPPRPGARERICHWSLSLRPGYVGALALVQP